MQAVDALQSNMDDRSPESSATIDRVASLPIPNCLNAMLVVFVAVAAVDLLSLASWLAAWYGVFGVGIVFSYLLLCNYALLHEATHDNLHRNPSWNYWLGVITGIFFLAPFSMIRVTHQGHHQRNRTDDEIFDLYYEGGWFLKCCQWYATLLGLFWPCIPVCAVLFAFCPRAIGLQLFSGPPFGNANVKDITPRDLVKIRLELLLTVAVFASMFWWLELRWQSVLVLYACFSLNWSTRQYVGHAFSKRDVIEGAFNLRHNFVMSTILLHGDWDLSHHRHPEVPWYYLPAVSSKEELRPSYVKHYWRQWLGPRLATEPPPSIPKRAADAQVAASRNPPPGPPHLQET
jgi:fatty acid desaturase